MVKPAKEQKANKTNKQYKKTQPVRYLMFLPNLFTCRLYVKGVFTGFRRGKTTQKEQQALIKIQGLKDRKDTGFYNGKRIAYVFKAKNVRNNTRYRVIWGTVIGPHGNNGSVRAHFRKNLPPRAMGGPVRVMLYPNRTI